MPSRAEQLQGAGRRLAVRTAAPADRARARPRERRPRAAALRRVRRRGGGVTVTCATDGNHGRSVAWGAQRFGCRCVIFVHENVSQGRRDAIARYGAEVRGSRATTTTRCAHAAATAEEQGWFVVSDTSYAGYRDIPRDVMQGYGVMAEESRGSSTRRRPMSSCRPASARWRPRSAPTSGCAGARGAEVRGRRADRGRLPARSLAAGRPVAVGRARYGDGGARLRRGFRAGLGGAGPAAPMWRSRSTMTTRWTRCGCSRRLRQAIRPSWRAKPAARVWPCCWPPRRSAIAALRARRRFAGAADRQRGRHRPGDLPPVVGRTAAEVLGAGQRRQRRP